MSRRLFDLSLVIGIALIGIVAALLGLETLLLFRVLAAPIVLVLPGYAIVAAIFDTSSIDLPERLLFSVALSFTISILSGFLLNWSPWGLATRPRLLLLASITLLCGVAAIARRRSLSSTSQRAVQHQFERRHLLMFGLAAVLTLGAITVARIGAARQDQSTARAQLWILPTNDAQASARLGIDNTEMTPISLTLRLNLNGATVQEWPLIELAPGQQWEQTVTLGTAKPGDTIEAFLYRASAPGIVYRQVILRPAPQP